MSQLHQDGEKQHQSYAKLLLSVSGDINSNEVKKKTVFYQIGSLLMRGREFAFGNPSLIKLSKCFYFLRMRELPRARNQEIILAVEGSEEAVSFEAVFKAIANSRTWDNLDFGTSCQVNTKNATLIYKI